MYDGKGEGKSTLMRSIVSVLGFGFQDVLPIYINFEELLKESWKRRKSLSQILSEAATLRWGSNPQGNPYVFINLPDMCQQLSSERKVAIVFADEVQELYKSFGKDLDELNYSDRELIRGIGLASYGGALVVTSGSSSYLPSIISHSENIYPAKIKEMFPLIDNMSWNHGKHRPYNPREVLNKSKFNELIQMIVSSYRKREKLRNENTNPQTNQEQTSPTISNDKVNDLNKFHAGIELLEQIYKGTVPALSLGFLYDLTGGNMREIYFVLQSYLQLGDDKLRKEHFFANVIRSAKQAYNTLSYLTREIIRILGQQKLLKGYVPTNPVSMSFENLKMALTKSLSEKRGEEYEEFKKNLDFYMRQSIDQGLYYSVGINNLIQEVSCPRRIWSIFAEAENEVDPELVLCLLYPSDGGIKIEEKFVEILCESPSSFNLCARRMDGKTSFTFNHNKPTNKVLLQNGKIPELVPTVYVGSLEQLIKNCISNADKDRKYVIINDNPNEKIPKFGKSLKELVIEKGKNEFIFFLTVEEANGLLAKLRPDIYATDLCWITSTKDGSVQLDLLQMKIGSSLRSFRTEVHDKRLEGQHKLKELMKKDFSDDGQLKNLSENKIWSLLFGTKKKVETRFSLISLSPLQPLIFNGENWWLSFDKKENFYEDYFLISRKELSKIWPVNLKRFQQFFVDNRDVLLCLHGFHDPEHLLEETLLKQFFEKISNLDENYEFQESDLNNFSTLFKTKTNSSLLKFLQDINSCKSVSQLAEILDNKTGNTFNSFLTKKKISDEIKEIEFQNIKKKCTWKF